MSTEQPGLNTYQLIALASHGEVAGWRLVGRYPDLDSTLRARVDDVITQLANNDGWLITCEHLLLGPGHDGPTSVGSHVTQLGADPTSDRVPQPYDERATREWLLAAHGLTSHAG
jgi:hypothetical protein